MNNPISRMPNPMAPMGQVPSIPPMGANPTAQNPSAMPLPVVNQPSVDMQTMGTTAEKRRKFNDLLESLSAPRQKSENLPNVQGLHYGGMAGGFGMPMMNPYMGMGMGMGMGYGGMGMNPYSMAYPSYSPGFGTTPTAPTTPTTPTDTSQNPFGNTISPAVIPLPTVAPSYGNMDSGTFPDASGNAMINNPSMGESPAMDAPVDPSDMPMFQPIDFDKQPTTPPSEYGVYRPDQLGAFVEDMLKKGNVNNPSVGQPVTDMRFQPNFGFGNVNHDFMKRIPGVGMREDQQYRAAVIDPNSPEEIEKRNKLMDYLGSLGTVPMNNFQGYERGGNVQYLRGGGPTIPSYNPSPRGGGVGRMREAKLRRLDPRLENRLGTNEEAAARSRDIQSEIDKLTKGFKYGYEFIPPNEKAKNDSKLAYDMAVQSTILPPGTDSQGFPTGPDVMPGEPGYDKARGFGHLNFTVPGAINSVMGYMDTFIPDFIKDREGYPSMKGRVLQPTNTLHPWTTDTNLLNTGFKAVLDAANPFSALGREAVEAIKSDSDKTGIASVIGNAISDLDLEDVTNVLKNTGGFTMDKVKDTFGFANGGPVQYLRGGGPSGPAGLLPHSDTTPKTPMEKVKEDNFLSKIINFFNKDAGPGPNVQESIKKPIILSSDNPISKTIIEGKSDPFISNFESPNISDPVPSSISKPFDMTSDVILNPYTATDPSELVYSPFAEDKKSYQGPKYPSLSDMGINEKGEPIFKGMPYIDPINRAIDDGRLDEFGVPMSDQKTSPIDIMSSSDFGTFDETTSPPWLENVIKDVEPLGTSKTSRNLYDFDTFDIGTGTPKITDPYNIGNMGEFDTSLAGSDSFERARRESPTDDSSIRDQYSGPLKAFGSSPTSPYMNPFYAGIMKGLNANTASSDNVLADANDGIDYTDMRKYDEIGSDVSSDSAAPKTAFLPPDRPENIGQQGFGLGQFLPLILGMLNPTAGIALALMQAMGGKGEGEGQGKGEGQGFLGGILPTLAKTLGIGDTERTFGDYTFRSLEDPKSGESAGMTPEERRELFLKNQASNERDRARRDMQENIDAITKPTIPEPILGEDGTYSCPSPYVYDPNTKMCVMMEAGLGGQGAAANEPKAPIAMQMGGQVSPSLNNAVDNFLQAFA